MIDTDRLRGIIAERRLSQRSVAKMLGMTEKTFYTKMKKGVFGTDELEKMVDYLNIGDPAVLFLTRK